MIVTCPNYKRLASPLPSEVEAGADFAYYRCTSCGLVWNVLRGAQEPIRIIIPPMDI